MTCKCKDGCEGTRFELLRGRFYVAVGCDCPHHEDELKLVGTGNNSNGAS